MAERTRQGGQALLEVAVITGLLVLGALTAFAHHRGQHPAEPLGLMGRRLEEAISIPIEQADRGARDRECADPSPTGEIGHEIHLRIQRRLSHEAADERWEPAR